MRRSRKRRQVKEKAADAVAEDRVVIEIINMEQKKEQKQRWRLSNCREHEVQGKETKAAVGKGARELGRIKRKDREAAERYRYHE